jgi:uncharacterized protein YcfJ
VTVQQVIHQRVCNAAVSLAHTPPSASETVAGAVIGGAIGGALAHGPGQAAATVLGAVAGASLIQQAQPTRVIATPLEQCVVQATTQSVPMFKVRFDWESKDYEVMLAQQPDQTIAVQVQGTHSDSNLVVAVLQPHHDKRPSIHRSTRYNNCASAFHKLCDSLPLWLSSASSHLGTWLWLPLCLQLLPKGLHGWLVWAPRLRQTLAVID